MLSEYETGNNIKIYDTFIFGRLIEDFYNKKLKDKNTLYQILYIIDDHVSDTIKKYITEIKNIIQ
jgi:hypothetical protein